MPCRGRRRCRHRSASGSSGRRSWIWTSRGELRESAGRSTGSATRCPRCSRARSTKASSIGCWRCSPSTACAMLVDRAVWQRIGLYDERLGSDDVDLCWRARLGGWRVVMTPRARVEHGPAHGDADEEDGHGPRYVQDRDRARGRPEELLPGLAAVGDARSASLLTLVRLLILRWPAGSRRPTSCSPRSGGTSRTSAARSDGDERRSARRAVRDHGLRRFTASAGLHLPALVPNRRTHPRGAAGGR